MYRATVIEQRESILYRFRSLGFHVSQLGLIIQRHQTDAANSPYDRRKLYQAADESLYLLDDLVFGAASMFDYWSGLVATIFQGPQKRATKWNHLVQMVLGKTAPGASAGEQFLKSSSTALASARLQSDWVDRLFGYRSDVIHTSAQKPDAKLIYDLMSDAPPELQIPMPVGLLRKLPFLGQGDGVSQILALQGAAQLYVASFNALADLSLSLSFDIMEHLGSSDPPDIPVRRHTGIAPCAV